MPSKSTARKMVTVSVSFPVSHFIKNRADLKPYAGAMAMFTITSSYKLAGYAVFPEAAKTCKCRVFTLSNQCVHTQTLEKWQEFNEGHHAVVTKAVGSKVHSSAVYQAQHPKDVLEEVPFNVFIAQPHMFEEKTGVVPSAGRFQSREVSMIRLLRELMWAHENSSDTVMSSAGMSNMTEELALAKLHDMCSGVKSTSKKPTKKSAPAVATPLDNMWKSIPAPKPTEYAVTSATWGQCLYAVGKCKNLLLTGPSGCGKTELVKYLGIQAKRVVKSFNFGGMTEPRASLIGNVNLDPKKGTWFSESRFVKAVTTPDTIVLLDELSRAPRDAFNLLLPVLDGQRYLALDETDDAKVVNVAKGVTFIATANIGMEYTGTSALDRALRDRFTTLELDFPEHAVEKTVVESRTKVNPKYSEWLVKLANEQRTAAVEKEEFQELISTRMLINAAEQIVFGVPLLQALQYCILGVFSGEGGDQSDREKAFHIVRAVIPTSELK